MQRRAIQSGRRRLKRINHFNISIATTSLKILAQQPPAPLLVSRRKYQSIPMCHLRLVRPSPRKFHQCQRYSARTPSLKHANALSHFSHRNCKLSHRICVELVEYLYAQAPFVCRPQIGHPRQRPRALHRIPPVYRVEKQVRVREIAIAVHEPLRALVGWRHQCPMDRTTSTGDTQPNRPHPAPSSPQSSAPQTAKRRYFSPQPASAPKAQLRDSG